jgi:hypothetical protein
MRQVSFLWGFFSLVLTIGSARATDVDVTVSKTAQDTHGYSDGAFLRTRGNITASANLYRSDDRSPAISVRARLWNFLGQFDPADDLKVVREGDSPRAWVYTWRDDQQRDQLIAEEKDLFQQFAPIVSAPGVLSRWSSTPHQDWRLAVEPVLQDTVITLLLRLEKLQSKEETITTISVNLPKISVPAGETRIIPVLTAESPETASAPGFLEIRCFYDWGEHPPRIRRRDYTGSWRDRIDIGGQLRIQGVYTDNVLGQ